MSIMQDARTFKLVLALCALGWVVIVAKSILNTKGPEDFVVTVTPGHVQAYAKQQLGQLQKPSFDQNTELCQIIFEDGNGALGTSPIIEGARASCDIFYFDEPGMAPVASLHTHGGFDSEFDSEVPSVLDMESDIASRMDGYVATPGGRLWRIDWVGQQAIMVCGTNCLPQDSAYRACPAHEPEQSYTLADLRNRFENDMGVC